MESSLASSSPASPIRTRSSNGFNETYRNEMLDAYAFESVARCVRSPRPDYTNTPIHRGAVTLQPWPQAAPHAQGSSPGTLVLNCVLAGEALGRDCNADGSTRRISRL